MGFSVVVSPDKEQAKLIPKSDSKLAIMESTILDSLNSAGVVHGILDGVVKNILSDVEGFEAGKSVVVAKATEAQHGENATMQFLVDVNSGYQGDTDEDSVDYKNSIKISSVKKGDVIAEFKAPTKGVSGKNVLGEDILPRPGKHIEPDLGINVSFHDEKLTAKIDGIISIVGEKISVSPVYHIDGDVNMETGNVNFAGSIVIDGDVNDGFAVEAEGDVIIKGIVGSSTIVSGGNIEIVGGMNGKDQGELSAKGDISAKFLIQSKITTDGKITVRKEINNCSINTIKGIDMPRGSLMGGNTISLGNIVANNLGSDLGVETNLNIGVHYRVAQFDVRLAEIEGQFDEMKKKIAPYVDNTGKYEKLEADKQESLQKSFTKFQQLKPEWIELKDKQQALLEENRQNRGEVLINKNLYAGVTIKSNHCKREFKEPLQGPFAVEENLDTASMKIQRV